MSGGISLLLLILLLSPPASGQVLRTVALSGQHIPGTPVGTNYDSFNFPPSLNIAGQTAFEARLTEDALNYRQEVILSEGSGAVILVAREGMQAPNALSGVQFVNISTPVLNDTGKLAFTGIARASNPGPSYSGVWTEQSGSVEAVILDGNQAPGTPNGVIFDALINGTVLLNSSGHIASYFFLDGNSVNSANDIGIWSTSPGNLGLIAREGNQAPGTPSGVQFRRLSSPVLNDAGAIAFEALITGSGTDVTNDGGIWSGISGNLHLVAREGGDAPGSSIAVKFGSFSDPVLNGHGQTAFHAFLAGSGVNNTNDRGIWSEGSGTLKLVARSGNPAAGTESDVVFSSFNRPVLNDTGQTAFAASLKGDSVDDMNRRGIWSGTAGDLDLVVRSGSQAPGTPSGAKFSDNMGSLVLNAKGQLAFLSFLYRPQVGRDGTLNGDPSGGVDSTNDSGLWATDVDGTLHLVAREGDPLEVAPNDFRIISSMEFASGTGNGDGRQSGFNNLGQIAFSAGFTDGSSGIFVSNLLAIPEPTTVLLSALAAVGLLMRRW